MAVFAIPNPKKSTIVDFPLERIKLSVQNINLVNKNYKFTKSNEIFNQYTFEALEFLSLGVYVDVNLNSISEFKTEITVEVRRKVGSFNQPHEVTKANEHLSKIFESIAQLTAKSTDEINNLKVEKDKTSTISKKDDRPLHKKKRFLIPIALIIFAIIRSQFSSSDKISSTQNETSKSIVEMTQIQKDSIKAIEDSATKAIIKENKEWDNSKAGKIQKKHPSWSREDCELVAKNRIWIGMSIDMLRYERGSPNSANPSNYGGGTSYQWCWDDYTPSCFYGKEDGIITSYN